MALFLPVFELTLQSLFELAFLEHVLRPNIYAVVHIKHFIPSYCIEFATAHWVAFGGWQCNFVKSTGVCTKMNAGLVHFYVNLKQQKKIKKKKKRIEGYSVKYIYIYFMRLCGTTTCPEIIRLLFFKSFSPSKYKWVVCMHDKVYNDMNEECQIIV